MCYKVNNTRDSVDNGWRTEDNALRNKNKQTNK